MSFLQETEQRVSHAATEMIDPLVVFSARVSNCFRGGVIITSVEDYPGKSFFPVRSIFHQSSVLPAPPYLRKSRRFPGNHSNVKEGHQWPRMSAQGSHPVSLLRRVMTRKIEDQDVILLVGVSDASRTQWKDVMNIGARFGLKSSKEILNRFYLNS